MATYSSLEKLQQSWYQLCSNWQSAKAIWSDAAQQSFEKQHWSHFEKSVPRAEKELAQILQMLEQAKRNCP